MTRSCIDAYCIACLNNAADQVASCLGDPELPVRVDAVVSLRHFLEEMEDVTPLLPALPNLLNAIFGLMNQVGGRCVGRIIRI